MIFFEVLRYCYLIRRRSRMQKPPIILSLFVACSVHQSVAAADKVPLNFESNSLKKNYKELVALGHKFYEEGAIAEALEQFEQASQLKPSIPPDLRYRMALLYHAINEQSRVVELLQSELTQKKIPEARYLIALSYKALKQYSLAEKHLRHYLELPCPDYVRQAMFELADVLFLQEKYTESSQLLESLFKRNRSPEVLLALAASYIWKGDFQRAETFLRHDAVTGEHEGLRMYLMGKLEENLGNYDAALACFSEAKDYQDANADRLAVQLAESEAELRLFLAGDLSLKPQIRLSHLAKVPPLLLKLREQSDKNRLPEIHYWIVRAQLLGDPVLKVLREELPLDDETYDPKILYLKSELAEGHNEKEEIYKVLTSGPADNPYVLRGWFMRGMNDLKLGRKTKDPSRLNTACFAFEQVWKTTQDQNPLLALKAMQAQLEAYLIEKSRKSLKQAIRFIASQDVAEDPRLLYLEGLVYFHAARFFDKESHLAKAEKLWEKALEARPHFVDVEFALGSLHFQKQELEEAQDYFTRIHDSRPAHPLAPEALKLSAECEEGLGVNPAETLKRLYKSYPESPQGAEAYLNLYSRQDYIKGRQEALEHLKGFFKRFPDSQWGIEAYYLLGMNASRDHYTSSGKLIRKKDLGEAAAYLQKASDRAGQIKPGQNPEYFTALKTQAKIERALVNLEIAEQAKGTKRQIYLEYTSDLLIGLIEELTHAAQIEECRFALATTYEKMGDTKQAAAIYEQMLAEYREAKITRGVYLARSHIQMGKIYKERGETEKALEHFGQAEDAAKGRVLTTQQYLDILIEQSLCHLDRDEDDRAMVILSRVINHDAASSLRLKAMFLRSHIYHKQRRDELAVRQLEALAKQQGEWAEKAKEELTAYEY